MKIAIIGTSNSVMRNNYASSLATEHEVFNLSSGRVPFYAHIKTILKNYDLLKSMDLVIIDHYINDVNFYAKNMGGSYRSNLSLFYALLAEVNVPIINYLTAIHKISDHESVWYYDHVKELSASFSFNILDLNLIPFSQDMYKDSIHLKREVSYFIGLQLSHYLKYFELVKPSRVKGFKNPFVLIGEKELREYPQCKEFQFTNSLMNISCFKLVGKLQLPNFGQLISLGYFNDEDVNTQTGITINGLNYKLDGSRYYHEATPVVDGAIELSPMNGTYDAVYGLVDRKVFEQSISAEFSEPSITELLYIKDPNYSVDFPGGLVNEIELPDLEKHINIVCGTLGKELKVKEVESVKNAALRLETIELNLSLKLMRIVKNYRPNSKMVTEKLKELRVKLKESKK